MAIVGLAFVVLYAGLNTAGRRAVKLLRFASLLGVPLFVSELLLPMTYKHTRGQRDPDGKMHRRQRVPSHEITQRAVRRK